MARNDEKPLAVVQTDSCQAVDRNLDEVDERFWQAVDRIRARNADKDPEEVYRIVTEVVEEVRRERYEREQRAQGSGGHQPLRQRAHQP